jgi:predicted ATPase with chaperone activity
MLLKQNTFLFCLAIEGLFCGSVVAEAFKVEIEVHAGWSNTDKIAVVGLPDTAVK